MVWTVITTKAGNDGKEITVASVQYPSRAKAARAIPKGKTRGIDRDSGNCVYRVRAM